MSGTTKGGEAIPREELDAAVRLTCRRCAAALASAMAETDTSFAQIAVKLTMTERDVCGWFDTLLDGRSVDLDKISNMATAMGVRMVLRLEPAPTVSPHANQEPAP